MSESTKTAAFVCAAIIVVAVAVGFQPRPPAADTETPVGTTLNEVLDPLDATRLEVVEYLEETAALRKFEVARINGRWVIPSHQNYPADAEKQMADAATSVMNRKILHVASTNAGDHALYGVVEPTMDLTAGATGVGTRVTLRNEKGEQLVNMVIGKPVKDQQGQRYVREVGKDPVYVVGLDPSPLSTDFGRWIEKDLLQLNPTDVAGLELKDYSAELAITPAGQPQILIDPRSEIRLDYDPAAEGDQWKIVEMKAFDPNAKKLSPVEVAEGEKVNAEKLDDLTRALDDLQIVDVERKPQGLSDDLKAEATFANNLEALQSLAMRGFYPMQRSASEMEIISSEGEVNVQMRDGLVYVLRFGRIAVGEQGQDAAGEETANGINRYVFVTARLNEDAIEKPKLEELPTAPAETPAEGSAEASTDEASSDEASAETPAEEAETPANEAAPEAETQAAEEQPAAASETAEVKQEETADAEAAESAEQAGEADAAPAEEATPQETAELETKRKAVEAANARKLAEYEEKVEAARERVKQLNSRFGDWYYVIPDAVYKRIHLGRDDILTTAEAPTGEGNSVGDLDALELQGLGQ